VTSGENAYQIKFSRSARKELEALDAALVNRIFPRIEALRNEPRPSGCRKLVGSENTWRIRVGDYRVLYSLDDKSNTIDIIAVRHRSKAYE
jgi:mRNA interferase RelE/StbE